MGWQDAPVVSAGSWQDAPVVGEEKKKPPQTEDPGFWKSALIGAGKTADDIASGLTHIGLWGQMGPEGRQAEKVLADRRASDAKEYAKLQEIRPGATALGETAPLLAMPLVGSGIKGAAVAGAIPGLVSYGTPEERAGRGAMGMVGGAAGGAFGKMIARAPQPFKVPESETLASARAAADRVGVMLRPDEITQSRPMGWAAAALNDLPFSGGMAQKAETVRKGAVNQAANRAMGQAGDEVTEATFSAARRDTGALYKTLLDGRQIPLNETFRAEVKAITQSKVMKSLRNEDVDAIIGPFQNMPAGNIRVSGEWFQQNKTALDNAIRGAYTAGETGKAMALEQFEKALERAAARSMSAEERETFKVAQKQWASLRLLETGKVVEGGNVMPGRLDQALTSRYKQAYKEGKIKGELADIGKMSQVFKPLPQSGTTPRAVYSGMAGGGLFMEPVTGAAMLAAPAVAQKFLQSKAGRKYLTDGLLNVSPEVEKWLTRSGAAGGLLSGPQVFGQ
jgi:hypothetical protein